ncbi:MAG: hypothetical protein Q8936_12605 [Bacillota bacterium]|nr:hypothetical protein [Bacillota bacterium]
MNINKTLNYSYIKHNNYIPQLALSLCSILISSLFIFNSISTLDYIISAAISLFTLFVTFSFIYSYIRLIKRIPDLIIKNTQIIIYTGWIFPKYKIINTYDISRIAIPKYDNTIYFTFKNETNFDYSLYGFNEPTINCIKDTFITLDCSILKNKCA